MRSGERLDNKLRVTIQPLEKSGKSPIFLKWSGLQKMRNSKKFRYEFRKLNGYNFRWSRYMVNRSQYVKDSPVFLDHSSHRSEFYGPGCRAGVFVTVGRALSLACRELERLFVRWLGRIDTGLYPTKHSNCLLYTSPSPRDRG